MDDKTFWADDFGDGNIYIMGEPSGLCHRVYKTGNTCAELAKTYAAIAAQGIGMRAVAPAGKPAPAMVPVATPSKIRVMIDPGHSNKEPGAHGKSPTVQEHTLNAYQADLLRGELATLGIVADIYNPEVDDLADIGAHAKGYDAFVSLHLNAFDGREHYTTAMCHATRQKPDSKSAKVASAWAQAIAEAINNPVFAGSAGWPKGVMAAGLSVLTAAVATGCPVCFLSEAEFCDDETDTAAIMGRLKKAMQAGARVLASALNAPKAIEAPVLKCRRTGGRDSYGLEILELTLTNTNEKPWLIRSGLPTAQVFQKGGPGNVPKSGHPCPQGEYVVRTPEWAGGEGNWAATFGPGLGPWWCPFDPLFDTPRGSFGFHFDSNHPKNVRVPERPAAGSLGCCVFTDLVDLQRFAAAVAQYKPTRYIVDWGL